MAIAEISDFEILEDQVLGEGGIGTLCRGRQRSRSRTVVIRLIRSELSENPRFLESFQREAEAVSRVEDRHLVPVIAAGRWKGRLFYARELVRGENLAGYVRQGHRFTTDEILHVAEGAGKALRAAWKAKVVHGDLQPSDIFLTEDGTVRVVDFGVARLMSLPLEMPLSSARWKYVSPERSTGDRVDIRSDLYSLGAILYELATGKPPFEGYDSPTSLLYQLVHVEASSPRELGSTIPKELERVVLRCLAKAPEERYPNPDEFLLDLDAVRRSLESSHRHPAVGEDDTGDYEIYEDQIIGEGGMGTLYRGRQRSLGRPVAVKVIRDVFTANPDFVHRFRREAELLAQVSDAHIVQVYGTGTWRGRLFYAMEYVEGKDLSSRLKEGHRFAPDEILHVAEGVAKALRALWRFKIVHRDVKPSNILLTREGHVKVADFGLAKSLRIPHPESHLIAGTSEYLSPEQGIGQPVDIRSDLYSLGVVLYELAAGKPPFKSDDSFTYVIYQHVHAHPPPLSNVARSLPDPLRRIIERCLSKKPQERYADPDEFLDAVRAARAELAGGSAALLPPSPPPALLREDLQSRATWKRTARAAAVLVGAAATAFACLAILTRGGPERDPSYPGAYELALGLGDHGEAMRLAERHEGRRSEAFREAARRHAQEGLLRAELRARERLAAGDWAGAAAAFEELLKEPPPARKGELEAAHRVSRDLAEAAEHEARRRWAEALRAYAKYEDGPAELRARVRARMDDLRRRLAGLPPEGAPK